MMYQNKNPNKRDNPFGRKIKVRPKRTDLVRKAICLNVSQLQQLEQIAALSQTSLSRVVENMIEYCLREEEEL